MILVTGAGGKTGKSLIKTLSTCESVCALVRREEQVSIATSLGAEKAVIGDMLDTAVIQAALQGARAIYHICPNMHPEEVKIGRLVIDEGKKAGIEHFVYHSVLHPQTEKMSHHWDKLRVEETLFESGLSFTVLQPAPYMQNLLGQWENILDTGVLRVPYSIHAPFSFVHLENLAETAAVVLKDDSHRGATYEIAGTQPMTHVEVAEIFGRILGQPVHAKQEEIKNWKLRTVGINEFATESLIKMFEYYDRWGLVGNPNVLRWLLGHEPASMESFIKDVVNEQHAIH